MKRRGNRLRANCHATSARFVAAVCCEAISLPAGNESEAPAAR
jgi:hypothetical protein